MTIQARSKELLQSKKRSRLGGLWFEKLMAIVALVNLMLVMFDLSYIPWRDFYLQQAPQFTQWYGEQFKGIQPHRFTENYLATVQQLEEQVSLEGLRSPEAALLLADLRTLSDEMIDENPFEAVGKTGTLERIKERMRDRVGVEFSKRAFMTFLTQSYLTEAGWQESIDFFNREVRPLIATNYFRQIGFDGNYVDRFWLIDIWFIGIFGIEFLARTIYLSRRYKGTNWIDAVIWRWYDLLLLLPFWRWLRVIPVTIRLNQSNLINLNPLLNRITRILISGVAIEITELVIVRIIDQLQEAIREGDAQRWLLNPTGGRRYIDLNNVNEVEAISNRLTTVLVYQVLPHIKPEVEALLYHMITNVLSSSSIYSGLQRVPGMKDWSDQLAQRLATEVSQNGYQAITASLEDEVGADLMRRLIRHFGSAFQSEIQQDGALQEIQMLSVALLEEIKINYVKRVEAEDLERLQERKRELYGETRGISRGFITD